MTGFFPGDAPVTLAGIIGRGRMSGIIGCVVAVYGWWLGLLLLVLWLAVRKVMLKSVLRQATELRGQTTVLRRAWYFIGVGSKARDAKEVRVFGLAGFVGGRFAAGVPGRDRRRATPAAGPAPARRCLLAGRVGRRTGSRCSSIADEARTHAIGIGALAILLPMLAVTLPPAVSP